MADDAASVLAPNAGPIIQLDPSQIQGQNDPLASYSPAQLQSPQPGQMPTVNSPQSTDTIPSQTTPAYQDPEVVAGAAHQSELAKIMHAVGGLLGGDKTYRATPQQDGSIKITNDDSTTGEMWRRVAAEALGGAAKGLAVGQGPGGAARATAAGIQSGLNAQQTERDQTNKDAEAQQQILMRNAQNAKLNQENVRISFDNKHMERDDLQAQSDRARKNMTELVGQGYQQLLMGAKDPKTIAQYGIANPLAVGMHMGANGDMIYNEPDGEGGVNIYGLSAEAGQRPIKDAIPIEFWSLDPEDPKKPLVRTTGTIPAGTKNSDVATRRMAINLSNDNAAKARFSAITDKEKADTEQSKATDTARKTDSEIAANRARAASENSTASLNNAKRLVLQGGAGTPGAAAGLKGEDYLQASGIDQAAWNQIRAAANGDVKMPTASRSPQNQAFRNAVMNYDPTFTDARYDTKINFKTKGDATTVGQLSTALGHLENLQKNSAILGFSPSLATGKTLSGPAADYNQDLKLFTQEAGKLIANKAITQGEYEDLKKGMDSPVQSFRDHAISETTKLIGGRVAPIIQKYKTGAGQELPISEFFDQPTQQRLIQHGFVPAPGGAQNGQQYTANSQYVPGKIYQVKDSSGNTVPIDGSKMGTAWQRDPKLTVLGVQ